MLFTLRGIQDYLLRTVDDGATGEIKTVIIDDFDWVVRYVVAEVAERQADAVESVLRLVAREGRAAARAALRPLQRELRRMGKEEAAGLARRAGRPGHTPVTPEPDPVLESIRPRRQVLGPICFDRLPESVRRRYASPRWSDAAFSLLCWCDGKRSLADAARLTARELRDGRAQGPEELAKRLDPGVSSLQEYFELLRQYGYVTW